MVRITFMQISERMIVAQVGIFVSYGCSQSAFQALRPEDLRRGVSFRGGVDIS